LIRLVIDCNIVHKVFDPGHASFADYQPVYDCIVSSQGSGQMVYGGTKYKTELSKCIGGFRKLFIELIIVNKLKELDKKLVDSKASQLKQIETARAFNDEHIVACVILGKAKVICSEDGKAHKYFKSKKLYPKRFKVPGIYQNKSHSHLLND